MVELPDTVIAFIGVGIPLLLGFFYFYSNRKDRNRFDTSTLARDEEEGERDKQELARKVKKELQDEAEKVETIRKTVAVDVRDATNKDVDQKIRETVTSFDHKLNMYEQKVDAKFTASDLIVKNLLDKIVETAGIQTQAISKINEAIDGIHKLLFEMASKVQRVENTQDKQRSSR